MSLKYCAQKILLKTHVAFFYESNCTHVDCDGMRRLACEFVKILCSPARMLIVFVRNAIISGLTAR
jgi:hypothetical protein